MNKLFFIILFNLQSAVVFADSDVSFGVERSIESSVLKEHRTYYVYLPPSYNQSSTQYPVVYLLDGDVHRWKVVAGMLEGLSTATLDHQIVESIVVAVPSSENAIRERDLTPTNVAKWTFKGEILEEFDNSTGNADRYLMFFKDELMPEINNKYRTSDQRIIVGESFGGLFAAYALLKEASVFTDYLIIDPTSIWDDNYLNRKYAKLDFVERNLNARVYMGFANNSALGDIGVTNLEWGREFAANIALNRSESFSVREQYFEDESHGTVALMSWYNGFKYLLRKETQ